MALTHRKHGQAKLQDLLAVSYGDTAPVPTNPGTACFFESSLGGS